MKQITPKHIIPQIWNASSVDEFKSCPSEWIKFVRSINFAARDSNKKRCKILGRILKEDYDATFQYDDDYEIEKVSFSINGHAKFLLEFT